MNLTLSTIQFSLRSVYFFSLFFENLHMYTEIQNTEETVIFCFFFIAGRCIVIAFTLCIFAILYIMLSARQCFTLTCLKFRFNFRLTRSIMVIMSHFFGFVHVTVVISSLRIFLFFPYL